MTPYDAWKLASPYDQPCPGCGRCLDSCECCEVCGEPLDELGTCACDDEDYTDLEE